MNEIKNKKWNQTKSNDSWSIFKIMGEFVEGYEKLSAIGPCISIFGSARTKPDNKYYKLTEENHVLHVQTKRCEATPVANENTLNKTGGKNACNRIYINRL